MVLTKKTPQQVVKDFKKAHKNKPVSADAVIHACGVAMITAYLHDYICRTFVNNNEYYSRKNKYYIDGLIHENSGLLAKAEALRNLTHPGLENIEQEEDVDSEMFTDEINTQLKAIHDFIHLYLFSSFGDFCNFALILDNIRKNKRVFTQEEVLLIMRNAIFDLTKIEPTNLLIEKYV